MVAELTLQLAGRDDACCAVAVPAPQPDVINAADAAEIDPDINAGETEWRSHDAWVLLPSEVGVVSHLAVVGDGQDAQGGGTVVVTAGPSPEVFVIGLDGNLRGKPELAATINRWGCAGAMAAASSGAGWWAVVACGQWLLFDDGADVPKLDIGGLDFASFLGCATPLGTFSLAIDPSSSGLSTATMYSPGAILRAGCSVDERRLFWASTSSLEELGQASPVEEGSCLACVSSYAGLVAEQVPDAQCVDGGGVAVWAPLYQSASNRSVVVTLTDASVALAAPARAPRCAFGRVLLMLPGILLVGVPDRDGGAGGVNVYDLTALVGSLWTLSTLNPATLNSTSRLLHSELIANSSPRLLCRWSAPAGARRYGVALAARDASEARYPLNGAGVGSNGERERLVAVGSEGEVLAGIHSLLYDALGQPRCGHAPANAPSDSNGDHVDPVVRNFSPLIAVMAEERSVAANFSLVSLTLGPSELVASIALQGGARSAISVTAVCGRNHARIASSPLPYACTACPAGSASHGLWQPHCTDCAGLVCAVDKSFELEVALDASNASLPSGSTLLLQLGASTAAEAASGVEPAHVLRSTPFVFDSTPPGAAAG